LAKIGVEVPEPEPVKKNDPAKNSYPCRSCLEMRR